MEYILAVAEEQHFGRAAKRCAVSQPALSKQVQEAEQLLQLTIFERTRPTIKVTSKGQQIVDQARRVLLEAKALVELAETTKGIYHGTLRLGVIPTLSPYVLPPVWQSLRATYPHLTMLISEQQTYPLLEALRKGELDVLLLALPVESSGYHTELLYAEPFVLAAPINHKLAKHAPVNETELLGEALLLLEEGHCLRDHALQVCSTHKPDTATEIKAGSLTTLMLMVEAGMGVTLLPASCLELECQKAPDIVLRTFHDTPQPSRQVGLMWRPTSPRAHLFRELGSFICQHIAALTPSSQIELHGQLEAFHILQRDNM
jgi:LysR family hydrogen peroxide-inducible transcriptional activator